MDFKICMPKLCKGIKIHQEVQDYKISLRKEVRIVHQKEEVYWFYLTDYSIKNMQFLSR
jgi:hypothetical protein